MMSMQSERTDGNDKMLRRGISGRIEQFVKAVITASLAVALMVLMGPVQDTNDDAMMVWQLSQGAGSLASFISPYLSLFMGWLYQVVPQIQWWSLMHVLSAWVLLVVVFNMAERNFSKRDLLVIYPIIFTSVWLSIMYQVNFTRTAIAFSLAGVLLLLQFIFARQEKREISIGILIAGVGLYCVGLLIRFQAGLLPLPFVFVILAGRQIELYKKDARVNYVATKGVLVFAAVTVILFAADTGYWNTHPDWKAYKEYSSARAALVDYSEYYPTWEQAKEQYKALGLRNENDLYILMKKMYIGDPSVYTLETLKSIGDLRGKSIGAWAEFKLAAKTIIQMLVEGKVLLWLLLWFILLKLRKDQSRCLYCLSLFCVSGLLLIGFAFSGRMMLRIWEPLLLCTLVLSMPLHRGHISQKQLEQVRRLRSEPFILAGLIASLLLCTGILQSILTLHFPTSDDDRDEFSRARADYINSTQDRIYLLSQPLYHPRPTPGPFGIWEAVPQNYMENYFSLSNWEANTPVNMQRLERYGITNPTQALIERTDTYSEFMDDRTFTFLKTHYGSNITCSFVDVFPDGGAVVQYAKPIESATRTEPTTHVDLDTWEADDHWQIKTWHVEGTISYWEGINNCQALYCGIEKNDGNQYTFRLALEDSGEFQSFFYDVDEAWVEDIAAASIVAMDNEGNYTSLGDLCVIGEDGL